MILWFKGGKEIVVFDIDRSEKKLKVCSSKSNYEFVDKPWSSLFDKGKEKIQEKKTDKLSDEFFIKAIEFEMSKAGYLRKDEPSSS